MRLPRTRAKGVSLCGLRRTGVMMCSTGWPRTVSASATSERWQRHGTASAHMIAESFACDNFSNRASVAQSAEFGQMRVGDVRAAQGSGEGGAIELRIVARARNGANVHEALDAVGFEQREKFGDGAIRVANRENKRTCA